MEKNKSASHKKKICYMDWGNISGMCFKLNQFIDLAKLKKLIEDNFGSEEIKMFGSVHDRNRNFYELAHRKYGYNVITKEAVYDKQAKLFKSNMDGRMYVEMVNDLSNTSEVVLMTGDGDFVDICKSNAISKRLVSIITPSLKYTSLLLIKEFKDKLFVLEPLLKSLARTKVVS
ncbi:MAG: NYN domain-containing protein [Flavobacteriales bacterium]|nr:NYN domain-containing protein [Flavobacteriales bacterium]